MRNPSRADLEGVVRAILEDVDLRKHRAIVIARGVQAFEKLCDELPSERIRRQNATALIEMDALGNTPSSAAQVARRWSDDPHTREILAQHFRRLRLRRDKKLRREKKTSTARIKVIERAMVET